MTPRHRLTLTAMLGALALSTVVGIQGQSGGEVSVQADLQAYMAARTAAYRNLTTFTFGVYSDIHMIEDVSWGLTRTQWQSQLTQWQTLGNLFGVIVGDLGFGNATDPSNVLSGPAAVPGAPPVFYVMGNHELDGIGKRAWIDALYPGAVRPESWTVQTGLAPGNADRAYWSFDIGPSTHFIMLDGDYMTYYVGRGYYIQTFGQAQLAWLADDINANLDKNVLVFVHEPIDQQPTGMMAELTLNDKGGLIDLLQAVRKQAFIFSGHFHGLGGITRWKGLSSVHVMTGSPNGPNWLYGVQVAVNGDQIVVTRAGTVTQFDQHPQNQVLQVGNQQVVQVAEDGTNVGSTPQAKMTVVAAENGVTPTSGSLMLKAPAMTWYAPAFISEQLVKIQPGMKFSFDMYLVGVVNGMDAVTVQPHWYMKNGSLPPLVVDQNGIALSQRPRDGMYFAYNEDVPSLGGRATGKWYHREFDLSALAGNYVDGVYLTSGATRVNVGGTYVDNIRFTWPTPISGVPPTVTLTAPVDGATLVAPATTTVTATASDADGSIVRVDFYANGTLMGSRSVAPYAMAWSGVTAGSYTLTAIATDNAGLTTTSNPASITVTAVVSVTPASGSGTEQTFSYHFSDPDGFADISMAGMLITGSGAGNACFVVLARTSNQLFLLDDAASSWLGPSTIGSGNALQNSQCLVDVANATAVGGTNVLTVDLPVFFRGTFAGIKTNLAFVIDNEGHNSDWQVLGTYTVTNQAPTMTSVTPSSGTGLGQTFRYLISDPNGSGDVASVVILMNATVSLANSCTMYVDAGSGAILLLTDTANGWLGPIVAGGAGSVQNSQCTIDAATSSISQGGTNFILNAAVSFNPRFTGGKLNAASATDRSGAKSDWKVATWVVP